LRIEEMDSGEEDSDGFVSDSDSDGSAGLWSLEGGRGLAGAAAKIQFLQPAAAPQSHFATAA